MSMSRHALGSRTDAGGRGGTIKTGVDFLICCLGFFAVSVLGGRGGGGGMDVAFDGVAFFF